MERSSKRLVEKSGYRASARATLLLLRFFDRDLDNGFAFVKPAERAYPVRDHRLLAMGAHAQAGDVYLPMGPAFAAPLFRMLSLRMCHELLLH
jgi:hypothetical protein